MTRKLMLMFLPAVLVVGCGDNTTTPDAAQTGDMAVPATGDMTVAPKGDMTVPPTGDMTVAIPPAPKLGAQLDRMGRPTINVAATNPFDLDLSALKTGATSRDATRDLYNADADPTMWAANWTKVLQKNLAIYDGADAKCGNQLLADTTKTDSARYAGLAGALADDRLYLDTSQTTCGFYLAVEANATIAGGTLKDCGGRTPLEPVVAETYTFLAIGPADFLANHTFAVTDGVPTDPDGVAMLTGFPFLAEPNP